MFNRMTETDRINARLQQIHERLGQVADIEAKAAPVLGYGARGEFEPERDRLIAETDHLLDRMSTIIGITKPIG